MPSITLDGTEHTGLYRGQCTCGDVWNGQASAEGTYGYSPALPVADAAVHAKLVHHGGLFTIVFTQRFKLWLERYWSAASDRLGASAAHLPPPTARSGFGWRSGR